MTAAFASFIRAELSEDFQNWTLGHDLRLRKEVIVAITPEPLHYPQATRLYLSPSEFFVVIGTVDEARSELGFDE